MVVFQHSAQQLRRRVSPMLGKHWRCLSCRNLLADKSSITTSSPSLFLPTSIRPRCFTSNTSSPLFSPASSTGNQSPDEILSSFANLDHRRAARTGFPEAVFGQGKTPSQIHSILDSMANNVNQIVNEAAEDVHVVSTVSTAIIATRIDKDLYDAVLEIGPLQHGTMEYHDTARIISVRANSLPDTTTTTTSNDDDETNVQRQSVVVACAGTTDLPVAEEAALTLTLSGIPVTRIYDCGVAGLHRIISALPKLRHPNVACVIVCAGMDGALPSVVGGLVDVPVVAIPTSVGYGMSLGGVSALLTMLNSCAPGVGVVNVDNGFGGAVWAMKCLNSRGKR